VLTRSTRRDRREKECDIVELELECARLGFNDPDMEREHLLRPSDVSRLWHDCATTGRAVKSRAPAFWP
jgi:hypothetical protein